MRLSDFAFAKISLKLNFEIVLYFNKQVRVHSMEGQTVPKGLQQKENVSSLVPFFFLLFFLPKTKPF